MPLPKTGADGQTAGGAPQRARRRRPPGQIEQARRKAWGQTWGKVGADYAKQLREREGR